jgi:hypothetical protein
MSRWLSWATRPALARRVVRATGGRPGDVAAVPVTAGGNARADHGGGHGARRGPWPVTAGGRGALRASEQAHETLHEEK